VVVVVVSNGPDEICSVDTGMPLGGTAELQEQLLPVKASVRVLVVQQRYWQFCDCFERRC